MQRHDTIEWVRHLGIALLILILAQDPLLASSPGGNRQPGAKGQTLSDRERSLRLRPADSIPKVSVNPGVFRQLGAKGQTFAMSERVRRFQEAASASETSGDRARESPRLAITAAKPSENRPAVDPLRSAAPACVPGFGPRSGTKSLFRRLAYRSPNSFGSPMPSLDSVAGRSKVRAGLDAVDRSFGSTYTPQVSCTSLLQRWAC